VSAVRWLAAALILLIPAPMAAQILPPGEGVLDPASSETVTGDWTFTNGGLTAALGVAPTWVPQTSDFQIGDGTFGVFQLGTAFFGYAEDTISGLVTDKVMIFYAMGDNTDNDISYLFFDGSTNTPRLVIPEEGPDYALYNPRSVKVGPATTLATVEADFKCSTDADAIDCNTATTGADLWVEDDIMGGGGRLILDDTFGDGFYTEVVATTATAIRTFTLGDDGGTVCTDTNGLCGGSTGTYGGLRQVDWGGGGGDDVTVTVAGTYYGWTTASAGQLSGVTAQVGDATADGLTVPTTGDYRITVSVSFSGSNNASVTCRVHVDDVITDIGFERKLGTGGAQGDANDIDIWPLTAAEQVDLRCTSDTNGDVLNFRKAALTVHLL
jgi:hypothetical protein